MQNKPLYIPTLRLGQLWTFQPVRHYLHLVTCIECKLYGHMPNCSGTITVCDRCLPWPTVLVRWIWSFETSILLSLSSVRSCCSRGDTFGPECWNNFIRVTNYMASIYLTNWILSSINIMVSVRKVMISKSMLDIFIFLTESYQML